MYLNDIDSQNICILGEILSKAKNLDGINIFNCDALTELQYIDKFANVLQKGKFDIIVGNPPCLGERTNRIIFEKYRISRGYFQIL